MMLRVITATTILATTWSIILPCKKSEFQCSDGKCVGMSKYCNGVQDCSDASDEIPNCTPCNISYYGIVGRTYELEVKRPTEIPFFCFLNFTAGGGAYGELVQLSFEAFAVGTFESFTNSGCPEGFISIKETNRPSPGGKWCGSAWGYTVYYSETSSVNLTLALDKLPQQQSSGYSFEFKLSYKFLKLSDAKIRYGNATQRSYRGKLSVGSYCDRLLEGCSRRSCRIQSPNYPGIYPRNVSCHYRVRERNVPVGKHALIAVRQANFHYKEHVPKFDNSDKLLRIWDQCNMMQDYIEIFDGWGNQATTLAHLCSGETIPEIISSGPELLLKFNTSPFGNPFHPLPLSYLPGFELEVEVFFVNKESPTYIEPGKKCEFLVTTFDNTSGLLESPLHSLPPNTTCHYHFRGQPRDIIWISFIKYHVTNERLTDFNTGECDVQLQIWDGDIKSTNSVQLIGQFCKDDKPKLCAHTLLTNSSRLTRPCRLSESYVSTNSDLTISHSIKYGSVLYPVNFVLRYEFVDLSQDGTQITRNPCDRLFKSANGRFYSPKITFLFGRGGQRDLSCTYQFESSESQRLRLTFNKAQFGNKQCFSEFNPEINRWQCNVKSESEGTASITISEYPWKDVEIKRHCLCSNVTQRPFIITTKTASKIVVKFTVTGMRITEDYHDYFFDANFEFIPSEFNCLNPWKNRRLRGSSGEITVRNNEQTMRQTEEVLSQNQTIRYCLQQPWLIEPEEDCNFIYLKIKGNDRRDSRLCPNKNRILVYPAGRTEDVRIICPQYNELVEMFSEGWSRFSYKKLQNRNSRSFVIEFLKRETGNFAVTWMEVSKNPALALPTSMLMIRPPECPHSCPELGACISSELWCDGLRHCPSGNDEQESNCSVHAGFPYNYLNSAALSAVGLVILTSLIVMSFIIFKNWRQEQKNVIVSVTEHTFLEFKSGLC
ncbi:uncharacterized protein LOC132699948 [Cylas formicarius]|uniref:uncharacterized protein LOC132699948 n=1 Tax=Cylas formicarius TaxID=197179 RepID=UPI002958734F|nr:uncharacterized protein LOC132699948 [Cylas formicarius]